MSNRDDYRQSNLQIHILSKLFQYDDHFGVDDNDNGPKTKSTLFDDAHNKWRIDKYIFFHFEMYVIWSSDIDVIINADFKTVVVNICIFHKSEWCVGIYFFGM